MLKLEPMLEWLMATARPRGCVDKVSIDIYISMPIMFIIITGPDIE